MYTEAVHKYYHILYSNECSPSVKKKSYNEDSRLPQEYMAMIYSLVEKKIQALKAATKVRNGGGGGNQTHNNGYNWKTYNKNHGKNVCFVDHNDKVPHNLKSLYKSLNNEWKSNKLESSYITPGYLTQENTKYHISTSHWEIIALPIISVIVLSKKGTMRQISYSVVTRTLSSDNMSKIRTSVT